MSIRLGTRVIQLTATDADASPLNSLISYRLGSITPSGHLGGPRLFAVDAVSGWVTVAAPLSEVSGHVTLKVMAEDHGDPVHSTTTDVLINVLSQRPKITSPPDNATIPVQQVTRSSGLGAILG